MGPRTGGRRAGQRLLPAVSRVATDAWHPARSDRARLLERGASAEGCGMSDGQLPKAYLRIDPNIDQTRPDLAAYVRLMCAANRQPRRGRFKSLDLIAAIVGRAAAKRYVASGDLILDADGRYYLDGWDPWQEGDLTVGDRVRRLRGRRNPSVSAALPGRFTDVTEPLQSPTPLFPPLQ